MATEDVLGRDVDEQMVQDVSRAEDRRCAAVSTRDWADLELVLGEDFVYYHWRGNTDDKAHYLHHLRNDFVEYSIERESAQVYVYGHVAIVIGRLRSRFRRSEADAESASTRPSAQVWRKPDGVWRLSAHYSFYASA